MLILVDEEIRRMLTTKAFLIEKGFDTVLLGSVDEARKFIIENDFNIDAIILDIMMPWGSKYNADETEYGLITGYLFFSEIRKELNFEKPIIIFTAAHRPDLFNKLRKEKNCSVLHKPEPPSRLIEELLKFNVLPRR